MQCILVKAGQRCQNDSNTFPYGLQVPIIKPEALAWICGDCIYEMYSAMTIKDFQGRTAPLTPEQIKKEFGR